MLHLHPKASYFIIFITVFAFSCKQEPTHLSKIEGKQININDSIPANTKIENFVTPYRNHLNKTLDSTLAYNPKTLSKNDGHLNTAIGNLMADLVFEQANPVFKKRTQQNIDFVLLNHGGIRSIISKGNISTRTAYQVMPFENNIVVLELTAKKVEELVVYLIKKQRAHPLSKHIKITLNQNNSLQKLLIHNKPINPKKTYFVATSDYLFNGGDGMKFFSNPISITETNYMIRNAMIDYFKKIDTLSPKIDNRFIKL